MLTVSRLCAIRRGRATATGIGTKVTAIVQLLWFDVQVILQRSSEKLGSEIRHPSGKTASAGRRNSV